MYVSLRCLPSLSLRRERKPTLPLPTPKRGVLGNLFLRPLEERKRAAHKVVKTEESGRTLTCAFSLGVLSRAPPRKASQRSPRAFRPGEPQKTQLESKTKPASRR